MQVMAVQPRIINSAAQRNVSFTNRTFSPQQLKSCERMIMETVFNDETLKKAMNPPSIEELVGRLLVDDSSIMKAQKDLIKRLGLKLNIKSEILEETMNHLPFSSNSSKNLTRETIKLGREFLNLASQIG